MTPPYQRAMMPNLSSKRQKPRIVKPTPIAYFYEFLCRAHFSLLSHGPSQPCKTEEDRGRRPPPSTSSPCPAWFFRLRSPFFRGSKTPIQKRFAPLQLLALVQLAQKRTPDF